MAVMWRLRGGYVAVTWRLGGGLALTSFRSGFIVNMVFVSSIDYKKQRDQ